MEEGIMCMPVQRRAATPTHMNQIPGDDQPASRIYSPELVASRQPSDDALARAAARGVMAALGVLYERHNQRVYAVCLRMTRNSAEAEDLTQQTFLIAHQKLHQLRACGAVRGWLLAVVRSCFLKSVRKARPTPAQDIELLVNDVADSASAVDPIDRRELPVLLPEHLRCARIERPVAAGYVGRAWRRAFPDELLS